MKTLEEIPDVYDVTTAVGDTDDDAGRIAEDLEAQEIIDLEADQDLADFEDDELAARLPEELHGDRKAPGDGEQEPLLDEEGVLDAADRRQTPARKGEVGLVYAGDLDGAQDDDAATALEADTLTDDDVEALGYDDKDPADGAPGDPTRFEIQLRNGLWVVLRDGQPSQTYGHVDRAVHETTLLVRELRSTGQPAVLFLQAAEGKLIEVTDDTPPDEEAEAETSAVVPDRSSDG
jgi:hypothetical protein